MPKTLGFFCCPAKRAALPSSSDVVISVNANDPSETTPLQLQQAADDSSSSVCVKVIMVGGKVVAIGGMVLLAAAAAAPSGPCNYQAIQEIGAATIVEYVVQLPAAILAGGAGVISNFIFNVMGLWGAAGSFKDYYKRLKTGDHRFIYSYAILGAFADAAAVSVPGARHAFMRGNPTLAGIDFFSNFAVQLALSLYFPLKAIPMFFNNDTANMRYLKAQWLKCEEHINSLPVSTRITVAKAALQQLLVMLDINAADKEKITALLLKNNVNIDNEANEEECADILVAIKQILQQSTTPTCIKLMTLLIKESKMEIVTEAGWEKNFAKNALSITLLLWAVLGAITGAAGLRIDVLDPLFSGVNELVGLDETLLQILLQVMEGVLLLILVPACWMVESCFMYVNTKMLLDYTLGLLNSFRWLFDKTQSKAASVLFIVWQAFLSISTLLSGACYGETAYVNAPKLAGVGVLKNFLPTWLMDALHKLFTLQQAATAGLVNCKASASTSAEEYINLVHWLKPEQAKRDSLGEGITEMRAVELEPEHNQEIEMAVTQIKALAPKKDDARHVVSFGVFLPPSTGGMTQVSITTYVERNFAENYNGIN